MASTLLKLLALSLCLNTFVYIGINYAIHEGTVLEQAPDVQGDIFDVLLTNRAQFRAETNRYVESLRTGDNFTATYSFSLKEGITQDGEGGFADGPDPESGSNANVIGRTLGFLDGLKMVIVMITKTFWRIAIAPILLFTLEGLPIFVAIIIGFPLVLIQIAAIVILIRGGGAP